MRVIARRTLRQFWEKHPQAEAPLKSWYALAAAASWKCPADVKALFGKSVDFVGDNRVIVDIGGNKYRLIAHIAYKHQQVLIKLSELTPSMTE